MREQTVFVFVFVFILKKTERHERFSEQGSSIIQLTSENNYPGPRVNKIESGVGAEAEAEASLVWRQLQQPKPAMTWVGLAVANTDIF